MDEEIQFLSPEAMAEVAVQAAERLRLEVAMTVTAAQEGQTGQFLDVVEHVAHAMGLVVELTVPGYVKAFYGWERDVWRKEGENP